MWLQINSATQPSRNRWNSKWDAQGTSAEIPLTVTLAAEDPWGRDSTDHQGPLRSSRIKLHREDAVLHRISPHRFSILTSRAESAICETAARGPWRIKDLARSACTSGTVCMSTSPLEPSDRTLGRAMQPAQQIGRASGRERG